MSPPDLYLASSSPRRRDLLKQIGITFELVPGLDVDESLREGETPEQYVVRLAYEKAMAGYNKISSTKDGATLAEIPVLGADTCIALDGRILGQPVDRDDAIRMLQCLSGRSHKVLTAIYLLSADLEQQYLSTSVVEFKVLELDEIASYWESGEPADKAGAYAIQGVAAKFISSLEGSFSAVVGLPLHELSEMLRSRGL
ncbi:MAG: septum formation inhibitor Maf [Gammaproteobacteria bacterium]|nr:septum formation inhibitor Maf [Gammaproteobacteria bacterium]